MLNARDSSGHAA